MGAKARGFLLVTVVLWSLVSAEPIVPMTDQPESSSERIVTLEPPKSTKQKIYKIRSRCNDEPVKAVIVPDNPVHGVEKRAAGDVEVQKRAPMGFQGMRGKKSEMEADQNNFVLEGEDLGKRAMGFQGMRGKKFSDMETDQNSLGLGGDDLGKRAMGFQGMRGKKDSYLLDELEKRAMGFQGMRGKKDGYLLDELEKRAMGFHGMRGKKDEDEWGKRAPMGFQGMRGKKQDAFEDGYEKRAPMGFQGMRGKKDEDADDLGEEFQYYESPEAELLLNSGLYDEELSKRAMGFQGMRGKKDDFLNEPEKRGSMGFHGMRGKKENELGYKRAMGFLGMRGKKSQDNWDLEEIDKRAPQSGFFGVRGKKAPSQAAFFGMRGKKAPQGFFGMRGKKSDSDNEIDDIEGLVSFLNAPQPSLERTRRATNWLRNSKKAKSAFFGVRGKKSSWIADDGTLLSLIPPSA